MVAEGKVVPAATGGRDAAAGSQQRAPCRRLRLWAGLGRGHRWPRWVWVTENPELPDERGGPEGQHAHCSCAVTRRVSPLAHPTLNIYLFF